MKKIILAATILFGLNAQSQNTIPTTTCTGTFRVNDSLNVNKDITALGDITSKGEVVSTDTLRAKEDVLASKDIKVEGSVYVNQDVSIEGKLTAKGGITFDGVNGLFRTAPTANSAEIIQLGQNSAKPLPYFYCQTPSTEPWNQFYYNGNFVSYLPAGSNTNALLVDAAVRIGVAPWNGNGVIDVSGVDANGQGINGLDINYFCKRNTTINRGWDLNPNNFVDGGTVYMGAKVDMQSSLKIGYSSSGNIDLNTSIEINQNGNNANGVKVNTYNTGVKAFSVLRSDNVNTFVVYGNGRTRIGDEQAVGKSNSLLTVSGEIDCKSLYVLKPTNWQDRVFKKGYKLPALKDIESYILENHHLPGVKSEKEIFENGYDVNEIDAVLLEKIENLYLYIIQQQKEIDELKKKDKNH